MNYRFIRCERQTFGRAPEHFIKVKQNQAVTPSQIAELTENGMAVSSYNNLVYDEGVPNPSLTLEQTRGIDVADVWQASQTAKSKLRQFHKSSINSQTE